MTAGVQHHTGLENRVTGLTHHHRHQHWQLWNEWAKLVETGGCPVGQWLFCFSDLCSWTHSPLQSGDPSQRLAKPWGDNFQGLSHEIQRQHPYRAGWAELEHPKWADGWDCGKNRFWWGQTLHLFLWGCLFEFALDVLVKPHRRDVRKCWIHCYFPLKSLYCKLEFQVDWVWRVGSKYIVVFELIKWE